VDRLGRHAHLGRRRPRHRHNGCVAGTSERSDIPTALRAVRILLTLTDGTPVDVTYCQLCTYRTWRPTDGPLELDDVLPGLGDQRLPR